MPRFFVKNNQINNNKITIIDEDVKHIKNVLSRPIFICLYIKVVGNIDFFKKM